MRTLPLWALLIGGVAGAGWAVADAWQPSADEPEACWTTEEEEEEESLSEQTRDELECPVEDEPPPPQLGANGKIIEPALNGIRIRPLPPLPPRPSTVLFSGPRDQPRVALTFDACSSIRTRPFDRPVVDALLASDAPATFFLGGRWMLYHAEETRWLASFPQFELAIHGFAHAHMQRLPMPVVREDLRTNQQILYSLTGRLADFFRPPYGEYNERLVDIAAELGIIAVNFDLTAGDADPTISANRLATYVIEQVRPGSIVVMHANGRGKHTAAVLPQIIAGIRARGLELATVGQLLWPEPPAEEPGICGPVLSPEATVVSNR